MIVEAVRPYYGFMGRYWKAGDVAEIPAGEAFPESCFRVLKADDPEAAQEKPEEQTKSEVPASPARRNGGTTARKK